MQCVACGATIPDDAAFCPQCGQRTKAGASISKATASTPAERFRAAGAPAGDDDVEQGQWRGGYSAKALVGYWILAAIVTVVGIGLAVAFPSPEMWIGVLATAAAIWVWLGLYYLYLRLSIDYELTNQRLVHRHGILRQVTDRIEVIDIDDVSVTQGIVERMLGVGTIRLLSSDTSDPTLVMQGIDNVQTIARMIDDARREERRRRGMYLESV
jgi:membrane protein YdbS with pleckstrin-like domain